LFFSCSAKEPKVSVKEPIVGSPSPSQEVGFLGWENHPDEGDKAFFAGGDSDSGNEGFVWEPFVPCPPLQEQIQQ